MPRRHLSAPPPGRLEAVLAPRPRVPEPAAAGWVPEGAGLADLLELPDRRDGLDLLDVAERREVSTPPGEERDPGPDVVGRHRRPAPPPPRLLTLPDPLRGAVTRPRRLAVLGLLLTLVGATVLFGVRVAWARQAATPHPVAGVGAGAGPSGLVGRSVPSAF